MYAKQPKKFLIIYILDILKRYTDEEHRLSRSEIVEILKKEYDMEVTPKTVTTNIMDLIECGYEIEYSETPRAMKRDEDVVENSIHSGYYLNRKFTDSELRLLIDGLLFSKYIPYSQCMELIKKLEWLSNKYFLTKVKHIRSLPENMPVNKEIFHTIDILDEAISKKKQVSFAYSEYGTDKRLHKRKTAENKEREYIINPYQMVAANSRYYLICNLDSRDNVSNYRLDKITDIKLLNKPIKPMKKVKGLENGLDLPKHMAEHIYMFAGDTGRVTFRINKGIVGGVIDWFGRDIDFFDETEDEITVGVTVNLEAMRYWALQYSGHIKVLSPESLVNTVKEDLMAALNRYM